MALKLPAAEAANVAIQSIGCGYDVSLDLWLKYRKRRYLSDFGNNPYRNCRLIEIEEDNGRDVVLPGGLIAFNVSSSIKFDEGEDRRLQSNVLSFQQMSQQFNQELSLDKRVPLGFFNSMFEFSGNSQKDASSIKTLAFDGVFISLYTVALEETQIVLCDHVKKAVPSSWEPALLARFIKKFGTHIIVGVKMGGKDVIYIKQNHDSSLESDNVQKKLELMGDERFLESYGKYPVDLVNISQINKDLVIICKRRGGSDDKNLKHKEWLNTVKLEPDVITMSFVPITSLLNGVSGSAYLSHAISLYLRYKPPIEELHRFLDFQSLIQWAPSGGYQGGPSDWDSARGGYNDHGNTHREGLMSFKQFIQELEDVVLPSEAGRRYQEYKSEYITTQKQAYFDAHKGEDWLKDKYHPTNLLAVIERRNDSARKLAKEFIIELQNGTLDVGPGITASSSNKSGQTSNPNSEDEQDPGGKRKRHGRNPAKDSDQFAPKAHPISSDPRRIQSDVEQALALVKKLDLEKSIEDNILSRGDSDRSHRDRSHSGSGGPVVIVRGAAAVKGLEGVELLDTLITYLYRIHGLDYYGMTEKTDPKGFRHIRGESKGNSNSNSDVKTNGTEWEKKLELKWGERLKGQDPLEVMTAKEKTDAVAAESLDPYVRKIRDEKYGWKYGCGAKGCTKLFHAAEFVHKHLKLKHPELVMEVTAKVREDIYFQNYMNDEDAPGGIPIMQPSQPKDRPQRRRPGMENRLKDDRGNRRDQDGRNNGGERFDNPESMDFQGNNEGGGGGGGGDDQQMFDSYGGQGLHAPFPSDIPPPPVLMPVPGAGPLGPFVPAPPEVAMRMLRDQGGPSPFEGGGRNGRTGGPQMSGPAPIIALPPSFRQDPRRLRSYQDLDAPEDEVTVIDYRSL